MRTGTSKGCSWLVQGLLLVEVLGFAAAATTPTELLVNPSLEAAGFYNVSLNAGRIFGDLPTSWADDSARGGPEVRIAYSIDRENPHNGTFSLRADVAGGAMLLGQFLTLQAGAAYRPSVWLRGRLPAGASGTLLASLSLRLAAQPYTDYGTATVVVGGEWAQLVVPFAALPGRALDDPPLACFFQVQLAQPGSLWVDTAALATLAASGPMAAAALRPPVDAPADLSFFGMTAMHMHEPHPAYQWPPLEFGVYRTWGSGVMWATIQPTRRAQFDWGWLDRDVEQAARRNQTVVFTLGQTPAWASSRPDEPSALGRGLAAPPYDIRDWEIFVGELARRYRGKIQTYEVWNEPNVQGPSGYFSGTPEELAQLAKAAAWVLRDHDPNATLLAPTIGGGSASALSWLDRYLAAGGAEGTMAIGLQLQNPAPELDVDMVQTVRQVLAARGLQRLQLWRGGVGYDVRLPGATTTGAAAYLARSYLVGFALGLTPACWYAYDDWEGEGLALAVGANQNDPRQLSEAGRAYRRLQQWLLGARMLALEGHGDGVWVAQLRRAAGAAGSPAQNATAEGGAPAPARSWVVWSTVGQLPLEVPKAWNVSYWQDLVSGNVTYWQQATGAETTPPANATLRLNNATLELLAGPMPVLLA